MSERRKQQQPRGAGAGTRMRRIGWLLVRGDEMATRIWTGKKAVLSPRNLRSEREAQLARHHQNTNPAEGSRQ